jgi:hypothetical protein
MHSSFRRLLCFSFLALASCSGDPAPMVATRVPPDIALAPLSVVIGRDTLTMSALVYRDFMPVVSPDGRGMIAVATVQTARSTPITGALSVDQVWVVAGDSAWGSSAVEAQPVKDAWALQAVVRDGPLWLPQTAIDVVVRLRGADGSARYLRVTGKQISAVF